MLRGSQILLPALLAILAMTGLQVQANETGSEEFGDWGFVCNEQAVVPDQDEKDAGKESCNLFQTALMNGQQENGQGEQQRVLLTRVGFLEGNEHPVLLITAPLGILLPPGITVEVEGHESIRLPVQRCDGGGCLAYVAMEDDFVEAMKKGDEARVTFYNVERRGVTIPLSLAGFTKGMQALVESKQ